MLATRSKIGTVHRLNPLEDGRWDRFVGKHPRASIFHTSAWLEALRRTYGYQPVAITTSAPDQDLEDAIVFCRVESWLTGRRLVSLPFSDHCEPLVEDPEALRVLVDSLKPESWQSKPKYIELRPMTTLADLPATFGPGQSFCFHQVDLSPSLDKLFSSFHKDSTQRKIRRAEREGLIYEEGRSEQLLDAFYRLMVLTRRRHLVPPQPIEWFRNLIEYVGESLKIRVAFKDQTAVAAILTLRHSDTLVYKYGCSDGQFSNLGGMHLLFWKSIQEAKNDGLRIFDLGRSDMDNEGLITFKNRWGATASELTYARTPVSGNSGAAKNASSGWKERLTKQAFTRVPDSILHSVGNILYKHVG
jgi:lipid II:glycine glycyltransferase (peptidoglycan interpeptide bridge formation enzyme)